MKDIRVTKRDGRVVGFDVIRIRIAILKAADDVNGEFPIFDADKMAYSIYNDLMSNHNYSVDIETIQDKVEKQLIDNGYTAVAKSYHEYRVSRSKTRQTKSDLMKTIAKIGVETDRDNANVGNNFSSKLLRIASETNKVHNLAMMPKEMAKLHEEGDLYYHDLDSYNLTTNCLHIPTGEILRRGFNTGYGTIKPPKRIEVAAELTCILLQSAQNGIRSTIQ